MALSALVLFETVSPLYLLAASVLAILGYFYIGSKRARLDHIPGPWLAKSTNSWRGYQAWKINHHAAGVVNYQINMIGRYGDVVRIGPTHVLVYDPQAIDLIYGYKQRLDKVQFHAK